MEQTITLKQGMIHGKQLDSGVTAYLGVPFARAPLGSLRWKAAQSVLPWEGIRDCTSYAPNITQVVLPLGSFYQKELYPTTRPMSEDGLYLNVWTPANTNADKLPVYVWIHGGAFREGSGAALQFIGENLAKQGIIVVTVTYRMGAFGFMAHPALTKESGFSGNYAFTDLVKALEFIKENAESFGGDPNNITIDGQSAGSMSVCALLCTPQSKGLFQQAITQSGSALGRGETPLADAEQNGVKLMEALHCATIDQMRLVPAEDIMAAVEKLGLPFRPVVDGMWVKETCEETFTAGKQHPVRLIAGSTAGEESMHEVQPDDIERLKQNTSGYATWEQITSIFPVKTNEDAADAMNRIRTIFTFRGMKWLADCQRKIGQASYLYCFATDIPDENGRTIGPFHSSELVYQFGNLNTGWRPWRAQDYALSQKMMLGLAEFCKTGSPNAEGLPVWEEYSPDNGCMNIRPQGGMGQGPFAEQAARITKELGL